MRKMLERGGDMGLGQVNKLTNQIDHVNQKYVYVVLVVLHLPFYLENKTF